MNTIVEIVKSILGGQNQFATGGLLLMIIGGLGVYLRAVPAKIWDWLVDQTTMMVTVSDDDASFHWVKEWLLEQKFLKRVRRVDLDTTIRGEVLALIPAPGWHWFWHRRRPFLVHFYRNEDPKGSVRRRTESLTFHTIGRQQGFLKAFVREVVACHERNVDVTPSLFVYDDGWSEVEGYTPRLLESVILNEGDKERLIRDIERFRNSRQRYRELGVPYHRGYLLHGPPGTGKTSLVSAIAGRFKLHVYAINLSAFTDRSLAAAVNYVPPNSVILFEDIDCMKSGKARSEPIDDATAATRKNESNQIESLGVTLSGLLNVLDGFSAPENVLFVMTSNVVESLDRALLRPGRIDYRQYMGPASQQQKAELYLRFFPLAAATEAEQFVKTHAATTMAEFQGLLLKVEQECSELDELLAQT